MAELSADENLAQYSQAPQVSADDNLKAHVGIGEVPSTPITEKEKPSFVSRLGHELSNGFFSDNLKFLNLMRTVYAGPEPKENKNNLPPETFKVLKESYASRKKGFDGGYDNLTALVEGYAKEPKETDPVKGTALEFARDLGVLASSLPRNIVAGSVAKIGLLANVPGIAPFIKAVPEFIFGHAAEKGLEELEKGKDPVVPALEDFALQLPFVMPWVPPKVSKFGKSLAETAATAIKNRMLAIPKMATVGMAEAVYGAFKEGRRPVTSDILKGGAMGAAYGVLFEILPIFKKSIVKDAAGEYQAHVDNISDAVDRGDIGTVKDKVTDLINDKRIDPEVRQHVDNIVNKEPVEDPRTGEVTFIEPREKGSTPPKMMDRVKDFLTKHSEEVAHAKNLESDFNKLMVQNKADELRARQMLKDLNLNPEDAESIYHYEENQKEPLSESQQKVYDEVIKPMKDRTNELFTRLRKMGVQVDNSEYTPRFVADRGGFFEKVKDGAKGMVSGLLRRSAQSFKKRTMKILTDEQGNRVVVSIKGGDVRAWRNGKGEYLGRFELEKNQDLFDRDVKPLKDKLTKLQTKLSTLKSVKTRSPVSQARVDKLQTEIMFTELRLKERGKLKEQIQQRDYPKEANDIVNGMADMGIKEGVLTRDKTGKLVAKDENGKQLLEDMKDVHKEFKERQNEQEAKQKEIDKAVAKEARRKPVSWRKMVSKHLQQFGKFSQESVEALGYNVKEDFGQNGIRHLVSSKGKVSFDSYANELVNTGELRPKDGESPGDALLRHLKEDKVYDETEPDYDKLFQKWEERKKTEGYTPEEIKAARDQSAQENLKSESADIQKDIDELEQNFIGRKEVSRDLSRIKLLNAELKGLMSAKEPGEVVLTSQRIKNIEKKIEEIHDAIFDVQMQYNPYEMNDKVFEDNSRKKWRLGEATTKEIEQNTNLKYHKNVLLNRLTTMNELQKVERAVNFIDSFKNSPEFRKYAMKIGTANIPEGWKTTNLQQFRGFAFEPEIADTLNFFAKRLQRGEDTYKVFSNVNSFLRTSIFFNPLIHVPNIGVHWAVNRGASKWFMPKEYAKLWKTGSRAWDAVKTQNQDYLDMLDSGVNLFYSENSGKTLHDLMMAKMGEQLKQDKTLLGKIAKDLGYVNPVNLLKAVYGFSSKVTWFSNDLATMQAIYEEIGNGRTKEEAISEVSKHIPNYVLPNKILGTKALGDIMRNPSFTMFGAYHYGALKSYGEMAKSLIAGVNGKERAEALDKMAMLALTSFVIYPTADKVAQYFTGDKHAHFRRAGAATLFENISKLSNGQIGFEQVLQSILTPAVGFKNVIELAFNKDLFTGKQIYHTGTEFEDLRDYSVKSVAPLGAIQKIQEGKISWGDYILSLGGISKTDPNKGKVYRLMDGKSNMQKEVDDLYASGNKDASLKKVEKFNERQIKGLAEIAKDEGIEKIPDMKVLSKFLVKPPKGSMKMPTQKKVEEIFQNQKKKSTHSKLTATQKANALKVFEDNFK